ncbi:MULTISPECIES: hypothetical protein [unclassified Rathayibacter]|uniref:hypothetical protein n=1 Tax=unclassified Rathayibacter TaxID=2609250 RepID=UPI001889E88E|nr:MULTISPECIES: hypothetical protein [unclassified Rathayibacter]MBF4461765.1 hypothetical protein [Rathayibacter sp. VKM Ac-2879]MBF4503177.1 hypothetical protein [Rathayibacter sp. VKM Ac-2878]
MFRRKILAAAVGGLLAVGGVLGFAAPASALSSGEMTQACRLQYQTAGWEAYLYYPDQGVYGWRCFYNNAPWAKDRNERKNLSVQNWCSRQYGQNAYFSNQSNAYSWYCA